MMKKIELVNMILKPKFIQPKKKGFKKYKLIFLLFLFLFYLTLIVYNILLKKIKIKINRKENIKICLCVIAKKENLYAKEYVAHYKKIGYNHIYIYDNNDKNDEKFEDVLQDEIYSNFVTIVDIRGRVKGQCYVYNDCYEKHHKEYDWLSFFDFDEFLEVKAKNIQEFVTNPRYNKCIVIKTNFLFYSDNGLLLYDRRPLEQRFTKALYRHGCNAWSKVTVRGGINENYWSKGCTPHTSRFKVTNCDARGKIVSYKQGYTRPNFKYAYLKHYYTKTAEEYYIKSSRGSAFNNVKWTNRRKKYKFRLFFRYNKKTKEKVEILKKLFNMTL